MTAARKLNRISVEDYLAGELVSPIKHDYLYGVCYERAETTNRHNKIAGQTFGYVGMRLRGTRWQPWNSDTKIRIRLSSNVRFYYPDLSVVRFSNPDNDSFQDNPVVVFEVLSEETRRIDEVEKRTAYLTIRSLSAYVLIEQDAQSVVVWRRTKNEFVEESYDGLKKKIPLPEVEIELPLAEIYQGVRFGAEPDE